MTEKYDMRDWPLRRYDFSMPLRYHLTQKPSAGVAICLHGFQDHALSMLRRMGWWKTELPFQVLAVNGPFPVPVWVVEGFKEAYSWYFRDTDRNLEFVSPESTAQRLAQMIHDLGLSATPKVLIGFSQGGYLAPYLLSHLKNVQAIVGVGTGYSAEVYKTFAPIPVIGIHGELDERIAIERSEREIESLRPLGFAPEFHRISGLKHRMDEVFEPLLRRRVSECLAAGGATR